MPATLIMRADHKQIFRVLTNLVRNARQAIGGNGKPGAIEISARDQDDGVVIRVIDTGPGLPQRARDNLFAAFQGGVRKGGTGLGLVIAAELRRPRREAGSGAFDAEGTEFRIIFPHGS